MMEKKTVAVDLDGVLAKYDGWKGVRNIGDPIPGAVEFLKDLSKFANVVIYTTRCSTDTNPGIGLDLLEGMVRNWLTLHGFVYSSIYVGQGKPIAAAYIDDRAVTCKPQENGQLAYQRAVIAATVLCVEAK
jgi:hypothetical protein